MFRMNRYLKKSEKILIFVLLLLAISAGFYYITFIIQANHNEELTKIYEEKKAGVEKVKNYLAANPDIEATMARLNERNKSLENIVPQGNSLSDFLQNVTKISYLSKTKLIRIQPAEVIPNTGYLETIVDVEVSGNYFSLLKFVKALEDGPRFYNIKKFTLQKNSNEKEELVASLSVSMFSFGKD